MTTQTFTASHTSTDTASMLTPRQARKAARWERRLLRMTRLSASATIFNMVSFARFTKNDDGTVTEHGWSMQTRFSAERWNQILIERRHPDALHKFVGEPTAVFTDKHDRAWPERNIACSRCGDKRLVSFFTVVNTIREGWCTR
jgi:hypothetical protein